MCVGGCYNLVAKLCLTLVTLWKIALQPPLAMGFSRQEYWSGVPLPSLELRLRGLNSLPKATWSGNGEKIGRAHV